MVGRLRPFMGQLGTTPAIALPDSHNAGDFGSFLIGAPHEFAVTADELRHRTDGHMDIDVVRAGAIVIISSLAALENYPFVAYKVTKAALIAFTQQVAIQNAEFGIRANVILPGLIDTPMAVDTRARVSGKSRAEVAAERDARVPLRRKMGTAWDVANAALFLASDEASFITGVALLVDGGGALNIG